MAPLTIQILPLYFSNTKLLPSVLIHHLLFEVWLNNSNALSLRVFWTFKDWIELLLN